MSESERGAGVVAATPAVAGRYERLGRRIALSLFLLLAIAFSLQSVNLFARGVFGSGKRIASEPCRVSLENLEAAIVQGASDAERAISPASATEAYRIPVDRAWTSLAPRVCEDDPVGREALQALTWLRDQHAAQAAAGAKVSGLVRGELTRVYSPSNE
jgi:hypothetical protein